MNRFLSHDFSQLQSAALDTLCTQTAKINTPSASPIHKNNKASRLQSTKRWDSLNKSYCWQRAAPTRRAHACPCRASAGHVSVMRKERPCEMYRQQALWERGHRRWKRLLCRSPDAHCADQRTSRCDVEPHRLAFKERIKQISLPWRFCKQSVGSYEWKWRDFSLPKGQKAADRPLASRVARFVSPALETPPLRPMRNNSNF